MDGYLRRDPSTLLADRPDDSSVSSEDLYSAAMLRFASPLAYLAHAIGFGWVGSGSSGYIGGGGVIVSRFDQIPNGEDVKKAPYTKNGRTVYFPKAGGSGYWWEHRLAIEFVDFKLIPQTNPVWGEAIAQNIKPAQIDKYGYDNYDSKVPSQPFIKRTLFRETYSHSVTTEQTLTFEETLEMKYEYHSGAAESLVSNHNFSLGITFKSGQQMRHMDYDVNETSKEKSEEFSLVAQPGEDTEWQIIQNRGTVRVPVQVPVLVSFGVILHGFTRWGGGAGNKDTSHLYDVNPGDRVVYDLQFGGIPKGGSDKDNAPLPEALARAYNTKAGPVKWDEMMGFYGNDWLYGKMNYLMDRKNYIFELNCMIDDIAGDSLYIKPIIRRRNPEIAKMLAQGVAFQSPMNLSDITGKALGKST